MDILIRLVISTLAVFVAAYILPGISLEGGFTTALVVAIVLGLVNTFIRPILLVLTIPLNILTLGLFTFVIMALMVMLVSALVPGFVVDGFWWAMAFAIIFSLINAII
ncbi:MAG: phage holin family protein [Parachlamydiaceae bacterium]